MWRPSPTPEESWSDASGGNEDGEWPVKAIVGEEVRLDGTPRYEVRWDNWHRKDGSNTTWETERFERVELIRRWNRKWKHNAVHKRLTDHRRQAYDEKLERKPRTGPTSTAEWDAEIEASYSRLQEPERGEANSRLRVRRANPGSALGSSAGASAHLTSSRQRKRSSPVSITTSSRDQSISSGPPAKRSRRLPVESSPASPRSATATSSALTRKRTLTSTPSSAGSFRELEVVRSALPPVIVSQPTLRGRVSSVWNKAAKEAKAARVRISPDISDDDFPRHLRKFKYLEKGYVFCDEDLQDTFNVSRGVFTTCDCTDCLDASDCSCRDLSEVYGLRGGTNFSAYSEGLYTFDLPRGVEVVECNKYCGCDLNCGNRVAQRPRDISVEIFDTNRYGWGVRALEDISRGKVLGTYTGTLVRREDVNELPAEHQGYLFDLDSTEIKNSENLGGKYTVDCYECGNWTRFVNHSCSPNMAVYCVVYDTIPYVNMPYVAFVASTDIQAGTELTIDYHPYAEEGRKGKQPAKGRDCRCGSDACRGWFGT